MQIVRKTHAENTCTTSEKIEQVLSVWFIHWSAFYLKPLWFAALLSWKFVLSCQLLFHLHCSLVQYIKHSQYALQICNRSRANFKSIAAAPRIEVWTQTEIFWKQNLVMNLMRAPHWHVGFWLLKMISLCSCSWPISWQTPLSHVNFYVCKMQQDPKSQTDKANTCAEKNVVFAKNQAQCIGVSAVVVWAVIAGSPFEGWPGALKVFYHWFWNGIPGHTMRLEP